MIIEFIYNMAVVFLFVMLSLRLKEHFLKSKISDTYYYKLSISLFASLIGFILMKRPFIYRDVSFDLKSIPLIVISYIYGWEYGLVAAIVPVMYRYSLGGEGVYGAIFFEILLSVIIGGIFHQKGDKNNILKSVNKKELLKAYVILLIIGFGMFMIFFDYGFYFWFEVISTFAIVSLFTLLNVIMLINESNSSIYHSTVEFRNLEENLMENRSKLKKTKSKINLIGKLSHEFKTPLNLIFSAVQILEMNNKENKGDKKTKKYIKIINQNGYRMLRLVNNLIDLVKMDADSFNLDFKNVDIVKLLKKVSCSVKDYIDSKKRKIVFNSELDSKVIKCDPVNIERIMLNLLSNAVKFTEENDKITINLYKEDDYIKFSVKDEGMGIKKEKLQMIFDEFSQVDDSTTRNSEGSGLGLSIVKSLVKMHNGKIDVKSKFGESTEFIISLPDDKISGEEKENIKVSDNLDKTAIELSDVSL